MQFSTDHAFHIGGVHTREGKPCQDFALSGVHENVAYITVSDGCSTGGMTDVGARVWALSARRGIINPGAAIPAGAMGVLGLDPDDLLATSLLLMCNQEGVGAFSIRGDGVVAFANNRGTLFTTKVEWANNTPCYPAYCRDNYAAFVAAQGGDLSAPALSWETWSATVDEPVMLKVASGTLSLGEGLNGYGDTFDFNDNNQLRFNYLALFSDGVQQVEGVEWYEAVRQLLAFKTTPGAFARRRMRRFLDDAAKVGRGPQDDIAYAVINLQPDEVSNDV